jgi:hypothetical protein
MKTVDVKFDLWDSVKIKKLEGINFNAIVTKIIYRVEKPQLVYECQLGINGIVFTQLFTEFELELEKRVDEKIEK